MPLKFPEIREVLDSRLVGRIINLQDVSDDGYEVIGLITEAKLEGSSLVIKTRDTRRRWWIDVESAPFRKEFSFTDTNFEQFHRNEFFDSLKYVEEAKIEADGTIILIPWDGFDYVYIRPQT